MEQNILKNTKKMLGISGDYTVFDTDILTYINSAFTILSQLGIGPNTPFIIDNESEWTALGLTESELGLVRTYLYLKVRYSFDPPTTGYLVEALQKQIQEHEWRLTVFRETSVDSFYATDNSETEVVP